MAHNPLEVLHRLGASGRLQEEYVSFEVQLKRPLRFEYQIAGFLGEEDSTDQVAFQKKMALLGGIHSNFSYSMIGKVEYPVEFANFDCEVMVNPSAGSDHIEFGLKGIVGDGRLESSHLLFRLYISPQQAKDIIERKLLANAVQRELEPNSQDLNSESWMRLRLHVVNYRPYPIQRDGEQPVGFEIIRVYC